MEGLVSGPAGPRKEGNFVDLLGLENCTTRRLDKLEHIILAHATYAAPMPAGNCAKCHRSRFRRATLPNKELSIWDIPRGGSPVLIRLTTWPMICSSCFHAQDSEICWYDPTRNMTARLREYILERAATLTTFKQIALDNCQEAKMVQAIVKQAFLASEMSKSKAHPRVLGIDEIYFGRKRYTVLVDIESGKAVDLLKGRSAESIKPRFEEASNRVAVEYVTQDFSMSYRSATVKAPKPKGKKGGSDAASDSSISGWQLVLFAERGADGTEDPEEAERAVRMSREELAAMLPNAKIVGDHFHFAQAILTEFFKRALNMIRNWREELIRIGTMGSSNTSRARLQD